MVFRVAVLDGLLGDVNDFQKNTMTLAADEGELIAAEVNLPVRSVSGDTEGPGITQYLFHC